MRRVPVHTEAGVESTAAEVELQQRGQPSPNDDYRYTGCFLLPTYYVTHLRLSQVRLLDHVADCKATNNTNK